MENRISNSYSIIFDHGVTQAEWEKFCASNGLKFAENLGDHNVYVGHDLEIVPDAPGMQHEDGSISPPASFNSFIALCYSDSDDNRKLLSKIADKFSGRFKVEEGEEEISPEELRDRIANSIRDSLGSLNDLSFNGDTLSSIQRNISKAMQDNKGVADFGVNMPEKVDVTWKNLYPDFWRRLRARFAFKVLRASTYVPRKPSSLMRWVGYRSERIVDTDELAFSMLLNEHGVDYATAVEEAVETGIITVRHISRLDTPYSYIGVDLQFKPVAPVEYVRMSVSVSSD